MIFDASTPKCKHRGSVTQRVFQFDLFDFSKGKITLYPVLCSSALQLIYFVSWMKVTLIINHFYWLQRLPLSRHWSWIYNPIKFIHFSACWGALRYIIPWVRFDFLSRLCGLFVKCPKLKMLIYLFIYFFEAFMWLEIFNFSEDKVMFTTDVSMQSEEHQVFSDSRSLHPQPVLSGGWHHQNNCVKTEVWTEMTRHRGTILQKYLPVGGSSN